MCMTAFESFRQSSKRKTTTFDTAEAELFIFGRAAAKYRFVKGKFRDGTDERRFCHRSLHVCSKLRVGHIYQCEGVNYIVWEVY